MRSKIHLWMHEYNLVTENLWLVEYPFRMWQKWQFIKIYEKRILKFII